MPRIDRHGFKILNDERSKTDAMKANGTKSDK
jgi:hypothetical protein